MWPLVGHNALAVMFVASIGVTVLLVARLTYSPSPSVLTCKCAQQRDWKDDSENPTDRIEGVPRQWRLLNPDYRCERLTGDNVDTYVRDHTSELFSNLTDPILRAAFLRYLIMFGEGGLWADIDVMPRQSISKWVREEQEPLVNMVIGIENDHERRPIWQGIPYSHNTMPAKPGHPIFVSLVDQVSNNLRRLMRLKAPCRPFAFTKAITGVRHNGNELARLRKTKLIGDALILPRDYFGWTSRTHTLIKADPRVLVVNIFMESWRNADSG
ncbi:hypothetical protein BJ166DRAFT_599891 [Pestalotiopsis sp. NC0098]|nr:hypothetical protein BJ166DRAFT_599891 [Pestalotiopsis sp. NC0098]